MGYYALRFLFTNIYHKEWAKEYLPTPKVAKTLPLVLSQDEVAEVLGAIGNFKHRTIVMLIYSTGARVSECVNIKLTDIDSRRMQVNIQEGKGLSSGKFHFRLCCFLFCESITKNTNLSTICSKGPAGKAHTLALLPCGLFAQTHVTKRHKSKSPTHRILSVTVLPRTTWNRAPACLLSNG